MGVPSFYRWLSKKFPRVVANVVEQQPDTPDALIDTSLPNPNGIEFDNLYLDMNGIIHPCCHPEDAEQPDDETEMIRRVFKYIDRIFAMVRPRKLLFMAIDGVAPRAKMNQQRSRRFRSAKEAKDKEEIEDKLRTEFQSKGLSLPPRKKKPWDSNVITPGTPFMSTLSASLHYYIQQRIQYDPGWKNIKVIFSDAKVPGEGEHKIMKFMRLQRAQPDFNPNTHHCLYGMDADLIMLGLATHDPYFTIIREEVTLDQVKYCQICESNEHYTTECTGEMKTAVEPHEEMGPTPLKPFQFLHLNVLREYLAYDLRIENLPFQWDLERLIDDFVFLCFFVGNDFLPHLPSLEIREGAIERLIILYKNKLPSLGGYLSENGHIDLSRVDVLLTDLGVVEDNIFKARKNKEHFIEQRNKQKVAHIAKIKAQVASRDEFAKTQGFVKLGGSINDINIQPFIKTAAATGQLSLSTPKVNKVVKIESPTKKRPLEKVDSMVKKLKTETDSVKVETIQSESTGTVKDEMIDIKPINTEEIDLADVDAPLPSPIASDSEDDIVAVTTPLKAIHKKIAKKPKSTQPDEPINFNSLLNEKLKQLAEPVDEASNQDPVRFGEDGWKQRYYHAKMHVSPDETDAPVLNKLFQSYAEGLSWVMLYYYEGCVSWNWYYPFHYAPMASDLRNLDKYDMKFELSEPFSPMAQLMGVLPSASAHCMPEACRELMMNPDSPIVDFYPEDFPMDLNGKKYTWQAVALLPWIDEQRLLTELRKLEPTFSPHEKERNSLGDDYLYVHASHPMSNSLCAMYDKYANKLKSMTEEERKAIRVRIDPNESEGMSGWVSPYIGAILPGASTKSLLGDGTLIDLPVVSCIIHFPHQTLHKCALLPGVTLPPPVLSEDDFQDRNRGGRPRIIGHNPSHSAQQGNWQNQNGGLGTGNQYSGRGGRGRGDYTNAAGYTGSYGVGGHIERDSDSRRGGRGGFNNDHGAYRGGYQRGGYQSNRGGGYQPYNQPPAHVAPPTSYGRGSSYYPPPPTSNYPPTNSYYTPIVPPTSGAYYGAPPPSAPTASFPYARQPQAYVPSYPPARTGYSNSYPQQYQSQSHHAPQSYAAPPQQSYGAPPPSNRPQSYSFNKFDTLQQPAAARPLPPSNRDPRRK